jgi:hypothetical protein
MNTSVKILIAAAILLAPTASFARGGMHGGNAGGMDHSMSTHWQGDVSSNTSSKTTKTWTTDHNKHEVIVQKIRARLLKREALLADRLISLELNGMGNTPQAKILLKEIERLAHELHQTVTI